MRQKESIVMDMNKKVMVKSNSSSTVVLCVPDLGFSRTFEKKGAVKPIPYEVLSQGIYYDGVEKLFTLGFLSIEDKEVRIDLGLEEEVVILDDNQKKRLLTIAPLHDLKEACSGLNRQQILELVYFAIENELGSIEKAEYLKKLSNIDIIEAIRLNKAAKED
jgi:hypothetical protein